MDHELLVDLKIEEGRDLIVELIREGYDVTVGFWAKMVEDETWTLYLGSEALGSMTAGDVFVAIYGALGQIYPGTKSFSDMAISYSNVKYAPPSASAEAIRIRDRHPSHLPIRLRAKKLGDLSIEEAYLYPRMMGAMSRDEVVQTVAALMSRSGIMEPSSITLRDGSSIQAVPTSIRRGVPGELQIVLHDLAGNTDRTISADEVVSIH